MLPLGCDNIKKDFSSMADEENDIEIIKLDSNESEIQNVEVKKSEDAGNVLHLSSSALASQIKKMAPSVNICDKQVTIEQGVKESSSSLLRSRSSLSTTASQIKVVLYGGTKKLSIIPEVEGDDISILEPNKVTEEVIEKAVKKIPVPMEIKRQRRKGFMIPMKKMPWHKRQQKYVSNFFQDLYDLHLWHTYMKVIEGRFGTAVVSYFLFIRWLLLLNLIILFLNLIFLVFPQSFISPPKVRSLTYETFNSTKDQKYSLPSSAVKDQELILEDEKAFEMYQTSSKQTFLMSSFKPQFMMRQTEFNESSNLSERIKYCQKRYRVEHHTMKFHGFLASIQSFLQGTGPLESTLLFIGSYEIEDVYFFGHIYNIPSAFLWVNTISFTICLIMMVKYSSIGIRETFLTRHQTIYFASEIFSAWNYCTRTFKAASLLHDSFVVELKSELSEARRRKELKERSFVTWAKIYYMRFIVNAIVLLWIAGCYTLIYKVTLYQLEQLKMKKLRVSGLRTLLIQYLPSLTVTSISVLSPFLFGSLVSFEKYDGQAEVNILLVRNAFLSLSSIIVLVNTVHGEITCEPRNICGVGKGEDCKRPRCWETHVGQQLYKLTLTQLFAIVATFIFVAVPRDYIVRYWNNKLTRLVGRSKFYLPTEVLIPIYSQTVLWLAVFYSPLLPAVTIIKFVILFYVKKAVVFNFSEPSNMLYRASRFNSTYMNILLLSFFSVLIVHFHFLGNIRPSLGCAPFSYFDKILDALREAFSFLPFDIVFFFTFILSGWFFIPSSIILCTVIYYYRKYLAFLKQMEENLKTELTILGQDKIYVLKRIETLARNI
ncbi:transmembrane channel-like protein 7 [Trichonephila clavata]|uniref:Transmembrane channel-like protein 7 n=1 Tax=Trichonephila clavata TaxID=2740835 RepID=A0A8X6HQZ9_TRICU|nr:transmembrane channel-like protein 7 [Trichonephila clavata]